MLDLNFVPQNTEVKNNNIFNTKISSKKKIIRISCKF